VLQILEGGLAMVMGGRHGKSCDLMDDGCRAEERAEEERDDVVCLTNGFI